tara:strand:+ start:3078 stop:3233 length:156 start_codon:yes stop_codon:yes gene_type:complete
LITSFQESLLDQEKAIETKRLLLERTNPELNEQLLIKRLLNPLFAKINQMG